MHYIQLGCDKLSLITSLFRVDWSKALVTSQARSKVRGIVVTLHEFFISEEAFLLHKMIDESSLLKSLEGIPLDTGGLRSHMLSVVAAVLRTSARLAEGGKSSIWSVSRLQRNTCVTDEICMSLVDALQDASCQFLVLHNP